MATKQLSTEAYNRLIAQAQKQGISADKVSSTVKGLGATVPGVHSPVASFTNIKAPIDMNVGENVGGISGPSAELYGFNTRPAPTVATPTDPIKSMGGDESLAYDPTNPQDYIWRLQAKTASGKKPTQDELYYAQKASYDLQQSQAGEAKDPYAEYIAKLEAQLAEREQVQKSQREIAMENKRKELEAKYGALRDETSSAGARQGQAAQSATSFSGFGRSTFNADQQVEIQKNTNRALSQLEYAKQAELQAYEAELAGADAEALAPMYEAISRAQQQAGQFQLDAIKQANEINAKTGASFQEAVQNILSTASASGMNMDTKGFEQAAMAMQGMSEEQQQQYLANFSEQEQLLLSGLSNAMPSETIGTGKNLSVWNPVTKKREGGGGGGSGGGSGSGGGTGFANIQRPEGVADKYSQYYNPNMISAYTAYIEKGQVPTQSQIKALGGLDTFASDAYNAYTENESKKLSAGGFQLTSPSFYATLSTDQRKTLATDMRTLRGVTQKMDSITKTINEKGLPTGGQTMFGYGRELKQKIKDLQLILKEEGIYNLGVLNGPDLTIIEGALPNIDTARWSEGKDQYIRYMNNMRKIFVDQVNSNIASQGLVFSPGQSSSGKGIDVGSQVNDVAGLPDGTIVEQNGVEYVIQGGKPVKKINTVPSNMDRGIGGPKFGF